MAGVTPPTLGGPGGYEIVDPGVSVVGLGDPGPSPYVPPSDYLNPPGGGSTATPTDPATLARTATKAPQNLAVTAEGALINLMYGRVLADKPKIFAVGTIGIDLVIGIMWGKGECNQAVGVYANKVALSSARATSYVGSQGQEPDPWLKLAIPGYNDSLLGICYSVVKVSQADYPAAPKFTSIWEAKLVYDPRTNATGYSENPALHFRDLATMAGLAVDDESIRLAAESCDWVVDGAPRRSAGVIFDKPNSIDDLLATLAKYAGCIYVRDAGLAKLVRNRPIFNNLLNESRDLTGMGVAFTPVVTFDQAGLDGQPNTASWVEDDNTTDWETIGEPADAVTVAADTEVFTTRGFFLKDASAINLALRIQVDSTTVKLCGVKLRTDTGEPELEPFTADNVGYAVQPVTLGGQDWWELLLWCDGTGTDTGYFPKIYPARLAATSVRATTIGNLELYKGVDPADLLGTPPMYKIAGAGDVAASFTDDETDTTKLKILQDSLTIRKVSTANAPNRVVVEYTDTSTMPWRRAFAVAPDTVPADPRTTRLIMKGIHSHAQARREAIEQLNYYTLTDLETALVSFDEGLEVEAGDVFDVDHSDGLTAKMFRATSVARADDIGHWAINGREFDPLAFSNEAQAGPTFPDTTMPDPSVVPDAPSVALSEDNYVMQTGTTSTRLVATWEAASGYAYNFDYEVRFIDTLTGLVLMVMHPNSETPTVAFGPLQEGNDYTVELRVRGVAGILGNPSSDSRVAVGKFVIPGDVPALYAIELGGKVFLTWPAAIDVDIWRYEIRYGAEGAAWAAMATWDTVDGLRATVEGLPEGTYGFAIKAIDSVGGQSENAAVATVIVTLDVDAYARNNDDIAPQDNYAAYSRDATNAAWNYGGGSPTVTFDQVGLYGVANTASKIIDNATYAPQTAGQQHFFSSRPGVCTVRFWIKKEASETSNCSLFYEARGTNGPGSDFMQVDINKVTGVAALAFSGGVAGQVYDYDVQLVNMGGNDWWEVCLAMLNSGAYAGSGGDLGFDQWQFSVCPGTRNDANTGACTVGNAEIIPNETLADVFGTPPRTNVGARELQNMTLDENGVFWPDDGTDWANDFSPGVYVADTGTRGVGATGNAVPDNVPTLTDMGGGWYDADGDDDLQWEVDYLVMEANKDYLSIIDFRNPRNGVDRVRIRWMADTEADINTATGAVISDAGNKIRQVEDLGGGVFRVYFVHQRTAWLSGDYIKMVARDDTTSIIDGIEGRLVSIDRDDTGDGNGIEDFASPLYTYFGADSFTQELVSVAHDIGDLVSGQFTWETFHSDVSGGGTVTLQLSEDNVSYTDYLARSVNAAARYVKIKITGLTSNRFYAEAPWFHVAVNVLAQELTGESTSLASGGKTINIGKNFTKVIDLSVTIINETTDHSAVIDAIDLAAAGGSEFDVYIFENGVGQQATDFRWKLKGT